MTTGHLDRIDMHPWDMPALLLRAPELREERALAQLWRRGDARLLELDPQSQFVADPLGVECDGELDPDTVFLGLADGRPWFARRTEPIPGATTIRDGSLSDLAYQLVSAGLAVLSWVESARHCPVCGGILRRTKGGFAAQCRLCGAEHFPRTDPAVIVAVLDPDDRVFLAHQGTWTAGRASILAGFVEAGESAEQAVHREVAEEARLTVESCRFVGSQPWPFPRSLMLGYVARSTSRGQVDRVELEWGGWYSRADVAAAEAAGRLTLPGPGSIARRILDAWRDRTLPAPE